MRRGAATDLMKRVSDVLAAPRFASVAGARSACSMSENGAGGGKCTRQSGEGLELKRNAGCCSILHLRHALVVAHLEALARE